MSRILKLLPEGFDGLVEAELVVDVDGPRCGGGGGVYALDFGSAGAKLTGNVVAHRHSQLIGNVTEAEAILWIHWVGIAFIAKAIGNSIVAGAKGEIEERKVIEHWINTSG